MHYIDQTLCHDFKHQPKKRRINTHFKVQPLTQNFFYPLLWAWALNDIFWMRGEPFPKLFAFLGYFVTEEEKIPKLTTHVNDVFCEIRDLN